ncbi:Thioredoxin reductase 1, partial [Phytophthora palmivora]
MESGVNLVETLAVPSDSSVATFHIAGWRTCPSFVKDREVAAAMQILYPDRVAFETHPFEDRDAFKQWLSASQNDLSISFGPNSNVTNHVTSPFAWSSNPTNFVGGCDELLAFLRSSVTL